VGIKVGNRALARDDGLHEEAEHREHGEAVAFFFSSERAGVCVSGAPLAPPVEEEKPKTYNLGDAGSFFTKGVEGSKDFYGPSARKTKKQSATQKRRIAPRRERATRHAARLFFTRCRAARAALQRASLPHVPCIKAQGKKGPKKRLKGSASPPTPPPEKAEGEPAPRREKKDAAAAPKKADSLSQGCHVSLSL
jgi:hypothetical protein